LSITNLSKCAILPATYLDKGSYKRKFMGSAKPVRLASTYCSPR